mmetsp:Transcript_12528/g.29925  ORF Transcript_12528/g.29925 Transcript_12528/m.29925 type:complete len:81 (+) Transcript_12528:553-795(+)
MPACCNYILGGIETIREKIVLPASERKVNAPSLLVSQQQQDNINAEQSKRNYDQSCVHWQRIHQRGIWKEVTNGGLNSQG